MGQTQQKIEQSQTSVRPARFAGSWYPRDPVELSDAMTRLFADAKQSKKGKDSESVPQKTKDSEESPSPSLLESEKKAKALIVPHSGLEYSGLTAAHAYASILGCENDYDTIFIIGPSHHYQLEQFLTLTSHAAWSTPLGDLECDGEIAEKLVQMTNLPDEQGWCGSKPRQKISRFERVGTQYEEDEHSIEMQLIFIRWLFRERMNTDHDVKIVPMMAGRIYPDNYYDYAKYLMDYFKDERTLFVISSDFCHWGKNYDFRHRNDRKHDEANIYKSIEELDYMAFDEIKTHDLQKFQDYLGEHRNTICGRSAIMILIATLDWISSRRSGEVYETKMEHYKQSHKVQRFHSHSISFLSTVTTVGKIRKV